MDFTAEGLVRIEGRDKDGEVLGHALALGESLEHEELELGRRASELSVETLGTIGAPAFERFRQADIDTSPRTLTENEVRAAVQGLFAMVFVRSLGFRVALGVGNKAGINGRRAFVEYGDKAQSYLSRIFLKSEIDFTDLFAEQE